MKVNKWTLGLAAVGLVSLPSLVQAEEKASAIMTALSSTTISGYVDTSAHWDTGTGNANPPGFVYNKGKQDGFNLNAVNLRLDKPLDEAQWAAGYRVDLLLGPNANIIGTQSSGIGTGSDFAITQAYVALRAPVGNGLDFKMGVFDTIVGYESYHSGNNPNYTRSYGNTIEPTTHTGVLATYQLSEMFGLAAGIANTYGPTINGRANPPKAESYKTYMGAIAFTAPESMGFMQGSTLYFGVINGFNPGIAGTESLFYIGGTLATPVKGLKLGASFDYAGSGGDSLAGESPYVNATALYASFQATEKLSFHTRAEYASTDVPGLIATARGPEGDKVFALTGTLQYDLWKNVLSRLELRWDHSASGDQAYGGDTRAGHSGDPNKRNAFLVAANVIYKF
jgi:hypothetical protein